MTHIVLHSKHRNLGSHSSTCEEIISQSDEDGTVVCNFTVNLAPNILQNPFSFESHINNDKPEIEDHPPTRTFVAYDSINLPISETRSSMSSRIFA
jgi:hypothetical protein